MYDLKIKIKILVETYMANVIKLRKGLDINLKGKPQPELSSVKQNKVYALMPTDFIGVTPKVVVHEGDRVKAGEPLFLLIRIIRM